MVCKAFFFSKHWLLQSKYCLNHDSLFLWILIVWINSLERKTMRNKALLHNS